MKQKLNLKEIKSFSHELEIPEHYYDRRERKTTKRGIKTESFSERTVY